jgi:hypothetical protein
VHGCNTSCAPVQQIMCAGAAEREQLVATIDVPFRLLARNSNDNPRGAEEPM